MLTLRLAVFACTTLGATASIAGGLPSASEHCARLFGSEKKRADNKERREATLLEVRKAPGRLEIVHSVSKWNSPARTRVSGIEMRGRTDAGARVWVDDSYGEACPSGDYELRVDDALGPQGRVLAVFRDAVLIERGESLAYLSLESMRKLPNFQMVWRSDFVWVAQQDKKQQRITAATGRLASTSASARNTRNQAARARAQKAREITPSSPQDVINNLPTTALAKKMRKKSSRKKNKR